MRQRPLTQAICSYSSLGIGTSLLSTSPDGDAPDRLTKTNRGTWHWSNGIWSSHRDQQEHGARRIMGPRKRNIPIRKSLLRRGRLLKLARVCNNDDIYSSNPTPTNTTTTLTTTTSISTSTSTLTSNTATLINTFNYNFVHSHHLNLNFHLPAHLVPCSPPVLWSPCLFFLVGSVAPHLRQLRLARRESAMPQALPKLTARRPAVLPGPTPGSSALLGTSSLGLSTYHSPHLLLLPLPPPALGITLQRQCWGKRKICNTFAPPVNTHHLASSAIHWLHSTSCT